MTAGGRVTRRARHRAPRLLGAAAALALLAGGAAGAGTLPTVREVMDRYVRALGGRAAIFRHRSMTVRSTLEVSGKDVRLDRMVYFKGARSRDVILLPGGHRQESGFDGRVAWSLDPQGQPAVIEGDEARSVARDADMYYPARILDYFQSMDVVDTATFEGHACYHLRGTTKWGKPNEHFYDIGTGLLAGYRFDSSWRGGAGEEREVFEDYRPFGRWTMPARIEHQEPGRTLTEVVSSITFDDVPDSLVALPPAVKALLQSKRRG